LLLDKTRQSIRNRRRPPLLFSASAGERTMPARTFWKGYLKLSLVTCPVTLAMATTASEKIRFHTLNRATGHRVVSRYVDGETGKVVQDDDQVAGYQTGIDQYVQLEDEDLEAVALESTRTIDIEQFAPRDSIESLWFDQPHFLAPNDPVGVEAFAVIRDAMAATATVGIAKLVLNRRERAVLLQPRGQGIMLWTLRYGDEVRDPDDYFGKLKEKAPESDLLKLARSVIAERTRKWTSDLVEDRVQETLRKVIKGKQQGKAPAKPKTEERPSAKVINIMDALKRSLAAESAGEKKRR
jgi:DNA end-binding protein Ku